MARPFKLIAKWNGNSQLLFLNAMMFARNRKKESIEKYLPGMIRIFGTCFHYHNALISAEEIHPELVQALQPLVVALNLSQDRIVLLHQSPLLLGDCTQLEE